MVDGLEHGDGLGEGAVALPQLPVGVDGLHLGDDVEVAALVELEVQVRGRFQPGSEAALGLADALGHGPDLAPPLGEERDDAVGLPQLHAAEDDAPVPIEPRHLISVTTGVSSTRR